MIIISIKTSAWSFHKSCAGHSVRRWSVLAILSSDHWFGTPSGEDENTNFYRLQQPFVKTIWVSWCFFTCVVIEWVKLLNWKEKKIHKNPYYFFSRIPPKKNNEAVVLRVKSAVFVTGCWTANVERERARERRTIFSICSIHICMFMYIFKVYLHIYIYVYYVFIYIYIICIYLNSACTFLPFSWAETT